MSDKLRKVLKPLIKECIKEIIFEEGVLSSIIREAQGSPAKEVIKEEKPFSKFVEEPKKEESNNNVGLLGALVAVVAIGAILSSDWDDDDNNCLFCGRDDDGETVIIKDYKLTATVTVKAINDSDPYLSSLRINFGGSERKRSMQFFREFFTSIDKSLFLDTAI